MNKTNVIRFIVCVLVAIAIKLFVYTGDEISDSKPQYKVEKELEQYLRSFVDIAALKGLDLSYIYDQDITIVWEVVINKNSTNVATSYGRNKDKIIIVVNKDRFYGKRTEQGRKYVMWHELGHDILNLEHLEEGMMRSTAYSGFFKEGRASKERQDSYLYKSLNGMFDIFIERQADNISDWSEWVRSLHGDDISDDEGKWDLGGFKMFGYRIISFTNDVTKEFYGFIGERGYKLIGIWKGEIAYAIETNKQVEVRDFNDKLLLTIKK